ncbi:MAG: guanylate kinase [Oscillospiraceae bacterium]|nr:guanylate kinase [Oscillospiraceae bacterium]
MSEKKGLLIVLSGPSGCGKGTMVAEILKRGDCAVSVSATTRAPREGEADHVHYHFISREEFERRIAEDGFLEHAQYVGNYYGTPRKEVEEMRAQGKHVILEIEVQGAFQIREKCPDAILVFTVPPTLDELRRRLHKRGTETEEVIEQRVARAAEELPLAKQYDYIILNDDLQDAVDDFGAMIRAEMLKPAYQTERIGEMLSC